MAARRGNSKQNDGTTRTKRKKQYDHYDWEDIAVQSESISSIDEAEVAAFFKEQQEQQSEEVQEQVRMRRLQIQMEDYLRNMEYDEMYSVGHFVRLLITYLGFRQKQFASLIQEDATKLNRMINANLQFSNDVLYKLEAASKIPIDLWFKIRERNELERLKNNEKLRSKAYKAVDDSLL